MDDYHLLGLICSLADLIISCVLLLLFSFHALRMFMNRTNDWRGFVLPFGFIFDATLSQDGRKHRKKAAIYFAVGTPFWLVCLFLANLAKYH